MKILVTGFDPFGGESINPSWEAVRRLPEAIDGADIIRMAIPTAFERSTDALRAAILEHDPDVVVCVGEAGGRSAVTPERVAINVDDAHIPDNSGAQPIDRPIQPDGPSAYFSSLPVKAMVDAMTEAGVPAVVSNTAGTYVCNHVMYELLFMLEREFPGKRGGFVHVPFAPEQVVSKPGTPSLRTEVVVKALTAGLGAVVSSSDSDQ